MPSDAEEIRALKVEVARLGRLVDDLYIRQDGIAPDATLDPANPPGAVLDAVRAGNLIEAIKLYRAAFNVGLAEAKHAVEQLQGR